MHEPLRVLHLSPEFPPLIGGIADYADWLTSELAGLGLHVRVLTGPRSATRDVRTVEVSGTVEHCDRRLWRAVAREIETFRPDVLHVHYQPLMYGNDPAIGFLPWALGVRGRRPAIVTTLHDMSRPARAPKAVGRLAFEALLFGSEAIIVSGEGESRGVAKRPGLKRRTTVVPIGSNIHVHPLMPDRRRNLRVSHASDVDAFLLAYFGLIRPGKGIEVLLDSIAELRARDVRVEFLLIGGVGDADPAVRTAYRDGLLDQSRRLGLEQAVHFLGQTPADEVSDLLQSCDLGVLPFLDGATPSHTSVFAALSHGLPLVVTRGPATSALFTEGAMALIPTPPQPATLAQKIEELMRDAAKRQALAAKGRELAERFSQPAIAAQIAEIYSKVARG